MNITIDMTSNYDIIFADSDKKTKPNKPNLSQFIVSSSNLFKSKTNPILSAVGGFQMNVFTWIRTLQ
jgi:hypothetical protein